MTENGFQEVAKTSALVEGGQLEVDFENTKVLLCRESGTIYAIKGFCSHRNKPLEGGKIRECIISCPWHAGKFDIRDGTPQGDPAFIPLETYQVKIEGDAICIAKK